MIAVENLKLGYRDVVAEGVSFEIAPGECVLLCGPNGSGKSTLMKTLAGLVKPLGGSISCGRVAMVPTGIPKVKGFTVEEFVRTSCYRSSNWQGLLSSEAVRRVDGALKLLGLNELRLKDIASLSDGQFQRACIATALTREADLILLDEPTAFLDVPSRRMVLQVLCELAHGTGKVLLFSSHDVHDAMAVADRVFGLVEGKLLVSDYSLESKEEVIRAIM